MLWPRLPDDNDAPLRQFLPQILEWLDLQMADRSALGMIGLLFGATTLFVMMMGAAVVADHLSGKLHLEDSVAEVAQPFTAR